MLNSSTQKKNILVTGGAGFLGSNLVTRLLEKGHKVIVVDNFVSGTLKNLQPFINHPNFSYINHDVIGEKINSDRRLFLKNVIINGQRLKDTPIDEIYNLACPASPPFYQSKEQKVNTLQVSVSGVQNVLKLAKSVAKRTNKHVKVLQFSTSEVYGNPAISPQPEGYNGSVSLGPRACYDEGKRAAETLINDWAQQHPDSKVDARIIRIFNTYGPGMRSDDGRVISNFIMQALQGNPITVYGNGEQTRSFCYVDDLLDGIERLMALEGGYLASIRSGKAICLNPNAPLDQRVCKIVDDHEQVILPELHQTTFDLIQKNKVVPINLGNSSEFTIAELAQKIITLTDSAAPIIQKPLPVHDPLQRKPITTLAKYLLSGWEAMTPLDNYKDKNGNEVKGGLAKTVEHFQRELRQQIVSENEKTHPPVNWQERLAQSAQGSFLSR